jgi:hypothetical protein
MATTTNYGWTTPDDTSLVKDGAAAIRTLGSSVDTTTKALNPSTTLGDVEYRSATANTNTRLGIGTTGQVLSVVGGVPAWTTPGGDVAWSLVNTGGTALSGAGTITVSGITKNNLMIYVYGGSLNTATQSTISFRFNSDTTSKYSYAGLQLRATTSYSGAGGAATINNVGNDINSQTKIEALTMGTDASDEFNGFLTLSGAKGSIKAYNLSFAAGYNSGATGPRPQVSGGFYTGSSAISSVSIITGTGSFDSGTIYVYEG